MVSELTVTIKDEEKRLQKTFLIYESYTTDENDPTVKECVEEVLANFDGEPSNISVRINLEMT